MNFITSAYRNLKLSISCLSGATAVGAIVAGIVIGGTGGTCLIVGGSLWTLSSSFSIFDSIAAHSAIQRDVERLQKNVSIFSTENQKLHGNITDLEKAKINYVEQNNKLIESVKTGEQQIKRLIELKASYDEANKKYQKILDDEKAQIGKLTSLNNGYQIENERLTASLDELTNIKSYISTENEKLKEFIDQNHQQIIELEKAKDAYISENSKLQQTNQENQTQLDQLKSQVEKLKELYVQSKELITNITSASDLFSQITGTSNSLSSTETELEHTVSKMKVLVDRLKDTTFEELDLNKDGVISRAEFDSEINKIQ